MNGFGGSLRGLTGRPGALRERLPDRGLLAKALRPLILATVGVYGAISHSAGRQLRGIRMALGAGRKDVLWMVIRRGLGLTLMHQTSGCQI